MPLSPWAGPGNHTRVICHGQLGGATYEWVRERNRRNLERNTWLGKALLVLLLH